MVAPTSVPEIRVPLSRAFLFEDSDPNGRRDHLWDRDVAEAFLQPDPSRGTLLP